jgi:hypothetical protein
MTPRERNTWIAAMAALWLVSVERAADAAGLIELSVWEWVK